MKTDRDETSSRDVDDPLPPRWVANIVGLFLLLAVILFLIFLVLTRLR